MKVIATYVLLIKLELKRVFILNIITFRRA